MEDTARSEAEQAEAESGLEKERSEFICDRCGAEMINRNCKVICPNCGNRFDCSDLNLYFD